jgi:hypothetical protein
LSFPQRQKIFNVASKTITVLTYFRLPIFISRSPHDPA